MTIEHKRSSKSEIEDLIKARYSLIWITSPEETRVEESLRKLCVEREMRLEVWSITEGMKTIANGQGTRDVKDPMKAVDHVLRSEGRALFVLRDFHPFLKEPAVVRRLRDAATEPRLQSLPAGTILERKHLDFKKPGDGIPAHRYPELLGRRTIAALAKDDPIRDEALQ